MKIEQLLQAVSESKLNELDLSYIIDTPKVVIKLIDAEDEDE